MATKCYLLEMTPECAKAVVALEATIPCFTDYYDEAYTIKCRVEDLPTVERYLAPFM